MSSENRHLDPTEPQLFLLPGRIPHPLTRAGFKTAYVGEQRIREFSTRSRPNPGREASPRWGPKSVRLDTADVDGLPR